MDEDKTRKRVGDGGTYLVVADDTPEFRVALRYAASMAALRRGHLAMAKVIEPTGFMDWGGVETAVRDAMRQKAEQELQALAASVFELTSKTPSFSIREGQMFEVISTIVKNNPSIVALVLGMGSHLMGPGPLVSHFTGKGAQHLNVPVILVPGHLSDAQIDKLS